MVRIKIKDCCQSGANEIELYTIHNLLIRVIRNSVQKAATLGFRRNRGRNSFKVNTTHH